MEEQFLEVVVISGARPALIDRLLKFPSFVIDDRRKRAQSALLG